MQNDAADLIAGHINATYRNAVQADDVRQSVASGKLVAHNQVARDLLAMALFSENSPALLIRCAVELEQPISRLVELYLDCKAMGGYPVPEWEKRV